MNGTELFLALVAGLGLGGFYFGSLWWVVQRLSNWRHPELVLLVSFLIRSAISLSGCFLVMGDRWERMAACLLGFLLARTALVHLFGPARNTLQPTRECHDGN